MRTAVLTIALCTASAPAFAGNNEITIGSNNRSLRTASANAVTDDNLGGGQLTAARQLHLGLMTNLEIWAAVGFSSASAEGELFGMPTEMQSTELTLGGNARYVLHPHLAFVGRVDAGPGHTSLSIEGNGHRVSDGRWGLVAGAAAGIDLLAVARPRFSLGFRFEVGYVTHAPAALSPAEESSEEMIELTGSQASIGHLDLGGRYYAFSVMSQF